ncbi:DUF349 domain-containing protein [Flavobacterium sp. RHBU_24]|uniref:DUF349 domain-containing protein n=1 Tax=Flavobacterium sp. RHBU_24 TaxID=3391185 RepID=UPI003985041F
MLEDKHDNLQNSDGNGITGAGDTFENGYFPNKAVDNDDLPEDADDIKSISETEGQLPFAPEELLNAGTDTNDSAEPEVVEAETAIEQEAAAQGKEAPVEEAADVKEVITEEIVAPEEIVAEEASEETAAEKGEPTADTAVESASGEELPSEDAAASTEEPAAIEVHHEEEDQAEEVADYSAFSMEALTDELQKLVATDKINSVKNSVEEVKREFYSKYNDFIEEKKEAFAAENNGDTTDFEYNFPLKTTFDGLYNQYRDKKNAHFKKVQNDQKGNLDARLAIVEELKALADGSADNLKDAVKQVNDLRERWKNAGPIPRDKYNHVFNNFHFHIERFYDHLHLDREARDLDFKHNLEQKQKIVERAKELVEDTDINKAFRELQALHKIWKEEIGPVSREHREEIWKQFSDLTRQLHDKREGLFARSREVETENLKTKQEIIAQIDAIAAEKVASHGSWQGQIDKIEALRDQFFKTGKVPQEVNEETWAAFKAAVRNFNTVKNSFYKDIKKDQQHNLNLKLALVEKANSLKDSDDFAATTQVMKQIQDEWKTIGHVPRKYSDVVWKDFKAACNHYFDRLHAHRNAADSEEVEAFEKKKEYLDSLKDFELTGDHKTDLDAIKQHIENWKGFGRVPQARRHIEGKFNKILDALFDKLSLSKKETDMVKFNNRLGQLAESDDSRKLENEQIFIMRKIDEVQAEIFQLENNIQFISNAKADNPFVKEVYKSIDRHKEELKTWKEKLKQIRTLNQGPKE